MDKACKRLLKPSIQIIVFGKKADLDKGRTISEQTAKLFCQENDVQYIKTSAATEYQVNDAFKQIKTRFLNLLQKGSIDGNIIKPKFLTSKKSDLTQQCNC